MNLNNVMHVSVFVLCSVLVYPAQAQTASSDGRMVKRVYLKAVSCYCGHSQQHGNVFVEYSDGKTEQLTTNDCAFKPQLASDHQTIGWAEGKHFYVQSYREYWLSKDTFVCYRNGAKIRTLHHDPAYADEMGFNSKGQIVSSSVGKHGPTTYQLYDVSTGKEIAHADTRDKAPEWANSLNSERMPDQQPEKLSYKVADRSLKAGVSAKSEVALIKATPSNATFAQIRSLLPFDTRFSKPEMGLSEWLYGNRIQFTGRISGSMYFLSKDQQEMRHGKRNMQNTDVSFHDEDVVSLFFVVADNGTTRPKSQSKLRVEAFAKYLGRPNHKQFTDPQHTDYPDDGGWGADWQLGNKRVIRYEEAADVFGEKRLPLLELNTGIGM